MKRILVIGSPGAGKTTLALRLSEMLHLPVVHLDKLHWRDNWQEAPKEEFIELLADSLKQPAWIMDGNYAHTIPLRLPHCDCVVYLDYSTHLCLFGALTRIIRNRGKSRPDMGGFCPERLDLEFLSYIWTFRKEKRPELVALLRNLTLPVYYLHSRRETEEFLAQEVSKWMQH